MIKVTPRALRQAIAEYLKGPPPGDKPGQWIDALIFQIDDANGPLAEHLRHLFHIAQERHNPDVPLDVVMMAIWTVFRANVLTELEEATHNN